MYSINVECRVNNCSDLLYHLCLFPEPLQHETRQRVAKSFNKYCKLLIYNIQIVRTCHNFSDMHRFHITEDSSYYVEKLERYLNRSEMWFFTQPVVGGYQCIVTIPGILTLSGEVASSRPTAKSNAAKAALKYLGLPYRMMY